MAKQPTSTTTAVTAPVKPPKSAVSNLALGNADDSLKLAKELQRFVQENKLTSTIQGKQFPNVEAWQFAGGLLGLSSLLESTEERSTADEIKWHATVKVIHLATGNIVGRGFATCSNKEHTKRTFADYAICSMAQTRAVGKAYRLALGWLMKAAGFEATPAEEMAEVGTSAEVVVVEAPAPAAPTVAVYSLDEAIKTVLAVESGDALKAIWLASNLKEHVGEAVFDLVCVATKVRWSAPEYQSPEQADNEVASRAQRDFAHKLLASHKNDAYRVEALHQLADAGLSWAAATTLVDTAQVNLKKPDTLAGGTVPKKVPTITTPARPAADAQGQPIRYATPAQKEEIMGLLNHPLITRQEKTKMIININRLEEAYAVKAIAKLQRAIEDREGTTAVAA